MSFLQVLLIIMTRVAMPIAYKDCCDYKLIPRWVSYHIMCTRTDMSMSMVVETLPGKFYLCDDNCPNISCILGTSLITSNISGSFLTRVYQCYNDDYKFREYFCN